MSLQTAHISGVTPVIAPDGSSVRPLVATSRASLATFSLAAGEIASAVAHRSVDELWFVVSGRGEMWRKHGEVEELTVLSPGVALTIPVGTHFQFRAGPNDALIIVGCTLPPWPGDNEAVPVKGYWQASR